jgi:hypothetical protein
MREEIGSESDPETSAGIIGEKSEKGAERRTMKAISACCVVFRQGFRPVHACGHQLAQAVNSVVEPREVAK